MRKLLLVMTVVVLVIGLAAVAVEAADDPFNGTWRMDPSKNEDSNPGQFTVEPRDKGSAICRSDSEPLVRGRRFERRRQRI